MLDIRPLDESEWDAAMRLTARAFVHEPFIVAMFGADPVARYPSVVELYRATPFSPDCLGAFSGDEVVGTVGIEREGDCHHCRAARSGDLPGTYHRNAAAAHLRQDARHGWVGRVAVEPALHGAGVGGALVVAALDRLARLGAPTALLDCEEHRISYYEQRGFTVLEMFDGSFHNRLALMGAQTSAS